MTIAIAEGSKNTCKSDLELVFHVDVEKLAEFDAIIFGAPTFHHDIQIDRKKIFETSTSEGINLKRKIGAAFGSYGWSLEVPKLLLDPKKNKFEMNVPTPLLLANYVPDEAMHDYCRILGENISETLIRQV